MKGLWIPYYILSMKNVLIIVKTLTNFLKFVIPLSNAHAPRKKKYVYVGIINLSWLKYFQKLTSKEHVLESNF